MTSAPIIFCHYGNSKYLKYVFECVKISNPQKDIILLGDISNSQVAKQFGIIHYNFKDFDFGEDLAVFDNIYKLIASPAFDSCKHGEDWNKFVFRKWFILNNFLQKNNIEKFWHFDSDNMIFSNLENFEQTYQEIDCTEQCTGSCMKGIFNNQKIIERYIKKINEVFLRPDLMKTVEEETIKSSGPSSFNEMSVYEIFKKEEKFKTARLNDIVENSSFDDLICRSHGLKMEKLPFGEDVKMVFLNGDGRFFCIEETNSNPVEMHALNLSWVPLYIFSSTLKHFKKNYKKAHQAFDPNSKTLSQITPPLKQRLKLWRKNFKKKWRFK